MTDNILFGRKASLLLVQGSNALDLSDFRIVFQTDQADAASPNNAAIRVYNLRPETMKQIQGEYSEVVLQAGYVDGAFGIVFKGNVRQWRMGKEPSGTETYLDILAADGDYGFNNAVVSKSIGAGSAPRERIKAIQDSMKPYGIGDGYNGLSSTGGTLPRGKVLFGLARVAMQIEARSQGATWSIQNGKINILPLDGFLPGEALVLTSKSGLIGRAEATEEGVKARCLINPRIVPGALIQIDNASINQTVAARGNPANVPFNQWTGAQFFADVAADGLYRVFVATHIGDTRGKNWYTDIIALAVNRNTRKVLPYG